MIILLLLYLSFLIKKCWELIKKNAQSKKSCPIFIIESIYRISISISDDADFFLIGSFLKWTYVGWAVKNWAFCPQ